jgi:hypothetical protein
LLNLPDLTPSPSPQGEGRKRGERREENGRYRDIQTPLALPVHNPRIYPGGELNDLTINKHYLFTN